ncbi:MAG: hypothetical protein HC866_23230 [Leptolyngbyaceae cyanobacterium RU_5_1]|nr:hypothetical protein [Leptolyngbyaceae cyanobacterium RU_5_1]
MTAPALTTSMEPLPIGSLLGYRTTNRAVKGSVARRSSGRSKSLAREHSPARLVNSNLAEIPERISESHSIWSHLLELLPQGLIIISRNLKPVYWNAKAVELCSRLLETEFPNSGLPLPVSEACHRLMRENSSQGGSLVLECQATGGQTLRVSARWLEFQALEESTLFNWAAPLQFCKANSPREPFQSSRSYMVVFLENCDEVLQEELQIQQRRYDLTEREAEIWMLLQKEYTYQEIATILQISLNTVKTHVKNVYAKRRSYQGKDKFWFCSK